MPYVDTAGKRLKDPILIVSNSIDQPIAQKISSAIDRYGIDGARATKYPLLSSFATFNYFYFYGKYPVEFKDKKTIILVGGPLSPENMGKIVTQADWSWDYLKKYLTGPGEYVVLVKYEPTLDANIFLICGYRAEDTAKAADVFIEKVIYPIVVEKAMGTIVDYKHPFLASPGDMVTISAVIKNIGTAKGDFLIEIIDEEYKSLLFTVEKITLDVGQIYTFSANVRMPNRDLVFTINLYKLPEKRLDYSVTRRISQKLPLVTYGGVRGRVLDENNNPISGATVNIAGKSAVTDAFGAYSISEISPGSYEISAFKEGYKPTSSTIKIEGGKFIVVTLILAKEYVPPKPGEEGVPPKPVPWWEEEVEIFGVKFKKLHLLIGGIIAGGAVIYYTMK